MNDAALLERWVQRRDAEATVFPEDYPDQIRLQQRFSDGEGAFELGVPSRENWMLRLEADGFAPVEASFEDFRSGGALSDGVVTLEAQ